MKKILFVMAVFIAGQAFGQEIRSDAEQLQKTGAGLKPGWNQYLSFNLGVNATSQKDVVAAQNGQTTTWNSKIEGQSTLLSGSSEWRNELLASFTLSRTPLNSDYLKSDDLLRLSSLYLWHLPGIESIGPFARLGMNTAMLPSHDVRATITDYAIAPSDENGVVKMRSTDRLKLTDAFSPFILKETVGAFYYPYRSSLVAIETLLGLGTRQTLAKNQLVIADDGSTPMVEVARLRDRRETGIDSKVSVFGQFNERLTYKAEAGMFVPMARSDESQTEKDKSNMEKRSWEALANLSFKLLDWASLEYLHRLQRDYSLNEKVQRTNTLLFNVAYAVGDKPSEEKK